MSKRYPFQTGVCLYSYPPISPVDFNVGLNSFLFPPSLKEPQHPKFMVSVPLDFHGGLNSVFPRHYKNNPNTLNAWYRMYLLRYVRINTTARGIHASFTLPSILLS